MYAKRSEFKLDDEVAIVRLEQLGPFPYNEFEEVIQNYNQDAEIYYV